jgi:hypothetical protein
VDRETAAFVIVAAILGVWMLAREHLRRRRPEDAPR